MKRLSLAISDDPVPHSKNISQARLPTNTTTRNHPTHRWYNFIAGFSPEFVSRCIYDLPKAQRGVLLDPFTGCGTAQVEGLRHGLKVFGYEPHPVFFRIATAKTSASADNLAEIEALILHGFRNPHSPSRLGEKPSDFLAKLFPEDVLARLVGARIAMEQSAYADDPLAFLILSKILDCASHSQTDGIYKAPASTKRAKDVKLALSEIMGMIKEDLAEGRFINQKNSCIIEKTSEAMSEVRDATVDIIVTSPPYLNNFDYAEMTRMYLYFWGIAKNWGEITASVRSKLIVNTTTALKGHKERQEAYKNTLPASVQAVLEPIVGGLAEARRIKPGKKEYDFLVYPYFSQMRSVLKECRRILKQNGRFHMMVADAALYGTHIPAPQVLAEILVAEGFTRVQCDFVRKRGHRWILDKREGSPIGLGEYHIHAQGPE